MTPAVRPPPLRELIAESPLVPAAIAATIGLLTDRWLGVPIAVGGCALLILLTAWAWLIRRNHSLASWCLFASVAFLTALHHHIYCDVIATDDISRLAQTRPILARLRGRLDEEPTVYIRPRADPLASYLRPDPTRSILAVREILMDDGWRSVSGRAWLWVEGPLADMHVGDEIEALGWLDRPNEPNNPGEWDQRQYLRDRSIRVIFRVRKTSEGVQRRDYGPWWASWPVRLRRHGQLVIQRELPAPVAGVASALLLGEDGSGMAADDWERYIRTGVVHVLAISGQHFVVLAAFLALAFKAAGAGRRSTSIIVLAVVVGYVLMTGLRPSAERAAVVAASACLAILWRRVVLPANSFALAWLVVIAIRPTDPFSLGCQLAFVQVAVLTWGIGPWLESREIDPLDRLIDMSRSKTERVVRAVGAVIVRAYFITVVLGLVSLPLVAARHHLVCISGFLIGPPVILLSSIALVAGFVMLPLAMVSTWLAMPFAWLTRWSLGGCEALVRLAERVPVNHAYVADIPEWWVWSFYGLVLATLWCKSLWPYRRGIALGCVAWLIFGLGLGTVRIPAAELRVTFLAVGHGGCTVLELPDGRVMVYDAGAMGGPEVTARQIAPFLWSRGIRRIDDLLLSHADLDHFNGVPDLLERFDVGQVICTPSFADKALPGVQRTREAIHQRGIPVRVVTAGDTLSAGDVGFDVLHPPASGPEGNENVRSLVLLVRHLNRHILLTGDLEGAGQAMVRQRPIGRVDVLMAPHHGSVLANGPVFAAWADATLAVVCDSSTRAAARKANPYREAWVTGVHGAITIRSDASRFLAETYRTGERRILQNKSD